MIFATDDYFTANLNLSSTTTSTLSETQSSNSDDSPSISELRITSNCESVASASDLNLQIGNIEFDNFEFDTKPQITTPKHQSRLSDRRQMSIPGPNFSAGAQPQMADRKRHYRGVRQRPWENSRRMPNLLRKIQYSLTSSQLERRSIVRLGSLQGGVESYPLRLWKIQIRRTLLPFEAIHSGSQDRSRTWVESVESWVLKLTDYVFGNQILLYRQ
ncbi:unnamed protein product [Camellia sinensis]